MIFAVIVFLFARLIACDWTWWDDSETLHHNPLLNPPSWATLTHYWTAIGADAPMALYVPVTYAVWAMLATIARRSTPDDYGIWLNPHVYHAANVVIHAMTAV